MVLCSTNVIEAIPLAFNLEKLQLHKKKKKSEINFCINLSQIVSFQHVNNILTILFTFLVLSENSVMFLTCNLDTSQFGHYTFIRNA